MPRAKELAIHFQPFKALEFRGDVPILCIVFESQPDMILTNAFPEIEAMRARLDKQRERGNETVSVFSVTRNSKVVPLVLVYMRQPWRRRKSSRKWDVDGINFYREVYERTLFAARALRKLKYKEVVILLPSRFQPENIRNDSNNEKRLEKFVRIVTEAVVHANYTMEELIAADDRDPLISSITLTHFGEGDRAVDGFFQRAIEEGWALGEATGEIRQLTLLPPNMKFPLALMKRAIGGNIRPKGTGSKKWRVVKGHNFSSKTKVSYLYGKEGILAFGLGLIHAVGKGSAHEPLFLKIHYRPPVDRQKPIKKVVIIGKGVTFDTGGMDAKQGTELDKMHFDMASAGTAINVVKLAEYFKLPIEIVVLIPLVENALGPHANRRHDVVRAYNGKTVEVKDTDAEGRMIMADAIAYAERHLKADCIITIGTLCDATDMGPDIMKVGFGNKGVRNKLLRAEAISSEKIMLMPDIDHLNEVSNEHVGDTSDLLNEPSGTYYHVAPFVFLYEFFEQDSPEWAFVDISALFESDADNYGCGPGFGLRFVWYLLKQYA